MTGDGSARKIRALINTRDRDLHETVVLPSGMAPIARPLSLLQNHSVDKVIGRVDSVDQEDDGITVEATVVDDRAWQLVQSGALQGVSIGFVANEIDRDTITRWTLVEVSLTPVASNGAARILEVREMETLPAAAPPSGQVIDLPATRYRDIPAAAPAIGGRHRYPQFHLSNVIMAAVRQETLSGFEREICAELEQRSDTPSRGVRVPAGLFQPRSPHFSARQVSTNPGSAQALSPQEWLSALLDDVSAARRWSPASQKLGFTVVSSLRETIHVPRRMTRVQAGWGVKDAAAPQSDTTFDEDVLTPLYAKVWVPIQRSALRYTDPAVDSLVTRDISEGLEDTIDQGILFGTGASEMPRGLLTTPSVTIQKNGQPIVMQDVLDIKKEMMLRWRIDDPGGQLRWGLNPAVYDQLRVTSVKETLTPGGEWFTGIAPSSVAEGQIVGVTVAQSGRFERRLVGTEQHERYNSYLVKGDMGIVCYFGGASVDMVIDPYTLSTQGAVRISAFVDLNCINRDPNVAMMINDAGLVPPP